jgi:hypothetical protein
VEEIQNSPTRKTAIFGPHWEGYPSEEDTRELVKNFKHAQEFIAEFHAYNSR